MTDDHQYNCTIFSDPAKMLQQFADANPEETEKAGASNVLSMFHQTAEKVPAYKQFLEEQGIQQPSGIKSIDAFAAEVPVTTKKNYFGKYPIGEMMYPGVEPPHVFSATMTSGTSGNPAMFLYSKDDLSRIPQALLTFPDYMWGVCNTDKTVLWVNCYATGIFPAHFWVNVTATCMELQYGNTTLTTPGADAEHALDIVENIGEWYDTVILPGYPTFLRILLDEARRRNIDWSKYNIKILAAGEILSEQFRDILIEEISDEDDQFCILDLLAASEVGVIGLTTPLAQSIKNIAQQDEDLCRELFGKKEVTALFQYHPAMNYLESDDNSLLVSKSATLPAIRYEVGDCAHIVSWREMQNILQRYGYSLEEMPQKLGWSGLSFPWPFIVHFGRKEEEVFLLGAEVAAHELHNVLLGDENIHNFKLASGSEEGRPTFQVFIELQPSLSQEERAQSEEQYQERIHSHLIQNNLGYADVYQSHPDVAYPTVEIYAYGAGPFREDKQKPKAKMTFQ